MAKYYFTNEAVEDLASIWDYTFETWSRQQANAYYEMLISSCEEIANNPDSGKAYNGITLDLFGLRTGRHIIFYKIIKKDLIEIKRILHEHMDLKRDHGIECGSKGSLLFEWFDNIIHSKPRKRSCTSGQEPC